MTESSKGTSRRAQWGLVAFLTCISMLAQIDKNILVLMVGPIQRDFGVGEVEISFLIGTAFAVANVLCGLPAGWLADRADRRTVVALAVALWSIAVASNAAASTFLALVVARVVVGAAEALVPPSAYSLIRDGVDESRRARALSVYTMALMLGTGLSLVLGGPLIGMVSASGIHALPLFGHVFSWQIVLLLVGIAGVPLSGLIFLSADPGRRAGACEQAAAAPARVGRYLADNRRVLMPLLVFAVAHSMITYGLGSWMPTMTARRFGLGLSSIGLLQGGLLLTMGPLGLWAAGWAMGREGGQRPATAIEVGTFVTLALTVLVVAMCSTRSLVTFWIVDAMVVLFSWTFMAVTSTLVAVIVPASIVGSVMAVVLVLVGLIGQGSAPSVIALVSRYGFGPGVDSLPDAMAVVFLASGVVALIAARVLRRRLRDLVHDISADDAQVARERPLHSN
ncbi:D-galactonate transporter [Paraburkholderia caffeinitolerans]|uniref:D-galactonate transporter n=1 Tax=Paraburkholderia caffeinitolerans TaxID=1723730 RepID=A0A6J5GUH0_9BURK|nr:MFS transporter [Paraburkholderia caffeinitolerans]CAB3806480.1 D-galactonate transporter [Paraburkholderia caffeinitolerans]